MTTEAAAEPRLHELLLENLLAVGVPEKPPAVSGIDVALVRDGRIAVFYTLLTAEG
jgi:hypothetical protein